MKKLSVIIPVYNEKNTIKIVLDRLKKVKINKEIIIVDDASNDGTEKILKKIKEKNTKVVFHSNNQGKGAAIKTALKHVNGDYIVIQDADLEYNPDDFKILLKPVYRDKVEVVYGSRFLGEHRNLLFWNRLGNHMVNLLINILYNTTLSDLETGYKVFKTSLIKDIDFKAKSFDFEPEITSRILKKKIYIYEVPVSYFGRDYSQGKKIRFKDAVIAFWTILKYRFLD